MQLPPTLFSSFLSFLARALYGLLVYLFAEWKPETSRESGGERKEGNTHAPPVPPRFPYVLSLSLLSLAQSLCKRCSTADIFLLFFLTSPIVARHSRTCMHPRMKNSRICAVK